MQQDGDEGRERAERVLGAVGAKLGGLWWAMLARGIIAVVVGFCALVWPSGSIDLLVMLVGVFVLLDGVTGLIGALQNGLRGANLLQAVLGIAIGLVLLLWPTASVRLLLVVFGVWFLLVGISQFWAARQNQMDGDDRNALSDDRRPDRRLGSHSYPLARHRRRRDLLADRLRGVAPGRHPDLPGAPPAAAAAAGGGDAGRSPLGRREISH